MIARARWTLGSLALAGAALAMPHAAWARGGFALLAGLAALFAARERVSMCFVALLAAACVFGASTPRSWHLDTGAALLFALGGWLVVGASARAPWPRRRAVARVMLAGAATVLVTFGVLARIAADALAPVLLAVATLTLSGVCVLLLALFGWPRADVANPLKEEAP